MIYRNWCFNGFEAEGIIIDFSDKLWLGYSSKPLKLKIWIADHNNHIMYVNK